MGAIYEAIDQHLGNRVALKQTLVGDAGEPLRRAFEREAKLLAGLHHSALPVVSDYFSDTAGQFLVMQFIPGDDLATLLQRQGGPFPLSDVLGWADQLLDALDYLHGQQPPVIHRDIKPQNLKLTPRGKIVLLDFGLAKGSVADQSHLAGGSSVFGYTPQYAPLEQIQGTGTDERGDLYALAATLYHLLTGQPPADALARVAAAVRGLPDPLRPPSELNPSVPPYVGAALIGALALDPARRTPSAAALRGELQGHAHAPEHLVATRAGVEPTVVVPSLQPRLAAAPAAARPWLLPVVAGGALLLLVSLAVVVFIAVQLIGGGRPGSAAAPQTTAMPGAAATAPTASAAGAAPTGRIAFMSTRDGNHEIYAVDADGSNLVRLTDNPADDDDPAWSPDGRRIAFVSKRDGNQGIYVMDADGSNVTRLSGDSEIGFGPAWSPDGRRIAFVSGRDLAIFVMNADGTEPKRLSPPDARDGGPAWSPDGRRIAFASTRDFAQGSFDIYVMNADGSDLKRLTDDPAIDTDPAWSPDGQRIAFMSTRNGNPEIHTMNADGTDQKHLTLNGVDDTSPAWSPDGRWIVFASLRDGKLGIYVMDAGGLNQTPVVTDARDNFMPDWAR
jgi:hypothetical protein